jgi:dnd system-associated protein 4
MSTLRRIHRDVSHEEFVKELTSGERPLFREIWRLLLLAAAVGVRDGVREPLTSSDSGKAMPESYFSGPVWRGFLHLIAIAETNDSNCLHGSPENQERLVSAFEEYANYGLRKLKVRVGMSPNPLEELTSFVLEATVPKLPAAELNDLI